MKANYRQAQAKQREIQQVYSGYEFAQKIIFVALNNEFGFGKARLDRLYQATEKLLAEEFADIELGSAKLEHRIKRLMEADNG